MARTIQSAIKALEDASPLNQMAKANRTLVEALARSGNFLSEGPAGTKAGQPQDFMGGAENVKMAEDERAGEKDDDEDGEEGAEGRIKRSTNKGKDPKDPGGANPGDSPAALKSAARELRNLMKGKMAKAFPPQQDDGDDDDTDEDDGPAEVDDGSGAPPMAPGGAGAPPPMADPNAGGAPPMGGPSAGGGDPSQNPQAQAIIQALAADPSLIEVVINFLEQNMAPAGGAPGMPPAGAPPAAAPMARSMSDHANDLTNRLAKSEGANDLIQAIEAAPAMEALTAQMIQYEAQSRAQFGQMEQILRSLAAENQGLKKSLNGLLGGVATLLDSQAVFQKSLRRDAEALTKSQQAAPAYQFNPGTQWQAPGTQAEPMNKSREGDLNLHALQKSLEEHAQEGDKQAAVLMGGIASDPRGVARRMSQKQWDTYEKLAPSYR